MKIKLSTAWPLNLKELREQNSETGLGLSQETIDELINYCEWLVNYYEKPHKFCAGSVPSVCAKCGRKRELHDAEQRRTNFITRVISGTKCEEACTCNSLQ